MDSSGKRPQGMERHEFVGTGEQWKEYRRAFDEIADAASREDKPFGSLDGFFKRFDRSGLPMVDAEGALWMRVLLNGRSVKVGLSASNVLAADSDQTLARRLAFSRVNEILKSPKHGRESMAEFKQDWGLLERFNARVAICISASDGSTLQSAIMDGSANRFSPHVLEGGEPAQVHVPANCIPSDLPGHESGSPGDQARRRGRLRTGFRNARNCDWVHWRLCEPDNMVHGPVQLGERLRHDLPSGAHVQVFENRHGEQAHAEILRLLDAGHAGTPSPAEKQRARIILYGHSWGATEAIVLARELEKDGVPVLLTVQVDSVTKLGQNDSLIPASVASAVNFYQTTGALHGQTEIRAADPTRTQIIGNYRIDYAAHPVGCYGPYPWYNQVFLKAHTEIECDPAVWNQVETMIRSKLR